MDNPYKFIAEVIRARYFNQEGERDGSYNFIHRTAAFPLANSLIETRRQLREEGKMLNKFIFEFGTRHKLSDTLLPIWFQANPILNEAMRRKWYRENKDI